MLTLETLSRANGLADALTAIRRTLTEVRRGPAGHLFFDLDIYPSPGPVAKRPVVLDREVLMQALRDQEALLMSRLVALGVDATETGDGGTR